MTGCQDNERQKILSTCMRKLFSLVEMDPRLSGKSHKHVLLAPYDIDFFDIFDDQRKSYRLWPRAWEVRSLI